MSKNEDGSALVWAIAVVMVLTISIGAALSISSAYYHRAMQTNDERQAYLSAKGVIEDIVNKIELNDKEYLALFDDLLENEKTYLSIPLASEFGEISTEDSYIECLPIGDTKGNITIRITAVVADSKYTVNADMSKGRIGTTNKWQLISYYQGEPTYEQTNNISIAGNIENNTTTLSNCWKTTSVDSDIRTCLSDEMKKDKEGYANVIASKPDYKPYNNNDVIRYYFYYREKPAGWPIFNKSEITNKELGKKLSSLNYYIQPFINTPDGSLLFMYAKAYKDNTMQTGWNNVNLFYYDGHWYYVDSVKYSNFVNGNNDVTKPGEGVMLTIFNTTSSQGLNNSAMEKWSRFVKAYLTPENRLQ